MSVSIDIARRNRLLDALPSDTLDAILPAFTMRPLLVRDRVVRCGEPIEEVFFPLSCVLSTVTDRTVAMSIEVATVGNEGMAGVPVYLGLSSTETLETFVQVAGECLVITPRAFREQVRAHPPFGVILGHYVQALLTQIAQASACNRLHTAEERCVRWVLMTRDRVGGDRFALSKSFLAQMLGLRPGAVQDIMDALVAEGLLGYTDDVVELRERARLEDRSCECYEIIRREYDRLLRLDPG